MKTASQLRFIAQKHNRKKFKREVIGIYNAIEKSIRNRSKKGYTMMTICIGSVWHNRAEFYAARFFAFKHRDFRYVWIYDGGKIDHANLDIDNHDKYKLEIYW